MPNFKEQTTVESPIMTKDHNHVRSTSLPSTSHPLTSKVEEQLNRLGCWVALSSSFQTKENLQGGFSALFELYEIVEDLLQFPHIQQVLVQHRNDKCVDKVLDGSVRLLDLSSTCTEVLLQLKEHVQETRSSLRRRRGEFHFRNEVDAYVLSKKKANKVINKSLEELRRMGSKHSISLMDKDHNLVVVLSVLRKVEDITLAVFQSLLTFISGERNLRKPCGWSLVSRLTNTKRVMCEEQHESGNEILKADDSMFALQSHKLYPDDQVSIVSNAQKQLGAVEVTIGSLEEGLESMSRQLIKSRVSLLNIISN